MAIASLVIGTAGMAMIGLSFAGMGLFPAAGMISSPMPIVFVVGLVLGIVAVVKKSRRGIAVAGIVLNAIELVAPIVVVIAVWSVIGD